MVADELAFLRTALFKLLLVNQRRFITDKKSNTFFIIVEEFFKMKSPKMTTDFIDILKLFTRTQLNNDPIIFLKKIGSHFITQKNITVSQRNSPRHRSLYIK